MKPICTRCILDTQNTPDLILDPRGVCNVCREEDQTRDGLSVLPNSFGTPQALRSFFDSGRRGQDYDCLVAFSGGKDGAFLLHLLKEKYGLRTLALTYDTGFLSEETWRNIRQFPAAIGVDHLIVRADGLLARDLFGRLLQTTGEICIACEMWLYAFCLKTALEKNIPAIAWGITGKQLVQKYVFQGIVPDGTRALRSFHEHYGRILRQIYRDRTATAEMLMARYFPIPEPTRSLPAAVYPFALEGYHVREVEDIVTQKGWVRPQDTGGISSNCRINILHIDLQKKIYGPEA